MRFSTPWSPCSMAQDMRLSIASRSDTVRSFPSEIAFDRIRVTALDSEPRRSKLYASISRCHWRSAVPSCWTSQSPKPRSCFESSKIVSIRDRIENERRISSIGASILLGTRVLHGVVTILRDILGNDQPALAKL